MPSQSSVTRLRTARARNLPRCAPVRAMSNMYKVMSRFEVCLPPHVMVVRLYALFTSLLASVLRLRMT